MKHNNKGNVIITNQIFQDNKKSFFFDMINLLYLLIGSLVGVGFVSGSEIYHNFARFGQFSYLGIIVYFCLIYLFVYKISTSNKDCLNGLKLQNTNKNYSKNTFLNKNIIKEILIFVNVLIVASAMISGLREIACKLFFNKYFFVMLTSFFVSILVTFSGIKCISKVGMFLVIFLILLSCHFINNLSLQANLNFQSFNLKNIFQPTLFSIIYVFMNISGVFPIVENFKGEFSKRQSKFVALTFSFISSILLFIFVVFLLNNKWLFDFKMPFLSYFGLKGGIIYVIYIIGLILGLFSTLVSCLFGVKQFVFKFSKSNWFSCLFAVLLVYIFGFIDYSFFIEVGYFVVGVLNFVIFVVLC